MEVCDRKSHYVPGVAEARELFSDRCKVSNQSPCLKHMQDVTEFPSLYQYLSVYIP